MSYVEEDSSHMIAADRGIAQPAWCFALSPRLVAPFEFRLDMGYTPACWCGLTLLVDTLGAGASCSGYEQRRDYVCTGY